MKDTYMGRPVLRPAIMGSIHHQSRTVVIGVGRMKEWLQGLCHTRPKTIRTLGRRVSLLQHARSQPLFSARVVDSNCRHWVVIVFVPERGPTIALQSFFASPGRPLRPSFVSLFRFQALARGVTPEEDISAEVSPILATP